MFASRLHTKGEKLCSKRIEAVRHLNVLCMSVMQLEQYKENWIDHVV